MTRSDTLPKTENVRTSAPVFTSILLDLSPKYGDPRGIRGDHLHAWFLTQVKHRDPSLAERLHTDTRHKPLALWVGPRFALGLRGVTRDTSDDRYWLRIASLDAELTTAVDAIVAATKTIVLGPAEFALTHTMRSGEHQWAGSTPSSALWERWMAGAKPQGRVSLRFISPTAFGRDRKSVHLFPTGELVFKSLIEIWNGHARPAIDDDLANALLDSVREERHEIWTVPPVSFGKYRVKGFMGTCEYSAEPAASRLLHLLGDFAFYSGVGLKRGMGMGQVLGEDASTMLF